MRTRGRLAKLILLVATLLVLLASAGCNSDVYVGVTAVPGPYAYYPGSYPYGGGGVVVGRPVGYW